MTIGLATVDTAPVARIAFVGIGVGGTLTLSRLAELADSSWSGLALDVVDRPESLGRGSAFGSDIAAAAVNTSQNRLESLSPSLHSFRGWLHGSGSRSTSPLTKSRCPDRSTATIWRRRSRRQSIVSATAASVSALPHARAVDPRRVDGIEVLGETADVPPADITVVAPGVWSPSARDLPRHR